MRSRYSYLQKLFTSIFLLMLSASHNYLLSADHNDPNAANSIYSDIDISPADIYGMFGYPSDDTSDGEKVIFQLTFASIPKTGVFDPDLLYRILIDPDPRIQIEMNDKTLQGLLNYAAALKDKYARNEASEVRVTFNDKNQAKVDFIDFPGGTFSKLIDTNKSVQIETPDGHTIKAFIGGRDDPFFNDLPGFFRSINYGPQFYNIPHEKFEELAEFDIPKTLLELEGNDLFNYNPAVPEHGYGVKLELPENVKTTWEGDRFKKDADGNYRFVYSGRDAQAGINVNAIILEVPLAFLTPKPKEERVVRIWGESWVLKAANKVDIIPDQQEESYLSQVWAWITGLFSSDTDQEAQEVADISAFKLVDADGVPFMDAALSLRLDEYQIGGNNIKLVRQFVKRLSHLGWGFGPSINALGLKSCFDHGDSPVSVHKVYDLATTAFPRARKCPFQKLYMPDDSWNKNKLDIPLKRTFELFVPNVTSVDMDTTGTWPFGRRPEDQVATRFLGVFLDMEEGCGGGKCNLETLHQQSLWDSAPIVPKTPPNPISNDKPFLDEFPYLAEPW